LKTYSLWRDEPAELPMQRQGKAMEPVRVIALEGTPAPLIGTETVIGKNLFDPERGASMTWAAEDSSKSFQRLRGMVLLGTAILEGTRVAIVQEATVADAPRQGPAQPQGATRLKIGDTVEGFTLSEITERKVVFTRGPAKIEVALDYFRKVDPPSAPAPAAARPPAAIPPRVVPNVPRRPAPPAAAQNANPNVEAREN
jgi:hypothetical protein